MQLTAIILAAAAAVVASPTNLEERQAGGVRATFYNNGDNRCAPPESWVEDTYFQQYPVGECHDLSITTQFRQVYFNESTTTRTLRFYDRSCADRNLPGTHSFDLSPNRNGDCVLFPNIKSWITI